MAIRRSKINKIVTSLLDESDIIDGPVSVMELIERQGITLHMESLLGDLSGFLLRENSRTTIGVNTRHHATRQRFTMAHELGHYMLHDLEQLHVDRSFKVRLRDAQSSLGISDAEREANLFAASLLMPSSFIANDLEDQDDIDITDDVVVPRLAKKYRVSQQALLNRLKNLNYIHD